MTWIACTHEMPPARVRVLCSTERRGTVIASYQLGFMGIRYFHEAHWQGDSAHGTCKTWRYEDVTHWMPLPMPVNIPSPPKPKDIHIYKEAA